MAAGPGLKQLFLCLAAAACGIFVKATTGSRYRRDAGTSARVPDVALAYENDWKVPDYCVTGDRGGFITGGQVPSHYSNPNFTRVDGSDILLFVELSSFSEPARGMKCGPPGAEEVLGPVMDSQAALIPERPSVTLSQGENLTLSFESDNLPEQVLWQKEPVQTSRWKEATLSNGLLSIPSAVLQGSGIYSVIPYTSVQPPGSNTRIFGTFSLLVRECPAHRYGPSCGEWCPDCLGGACHPATGECVCPPGLKGHRCHDECSSSRWGAGCSQTCSHCSTGRCRSWNGLCYGKYVPCMGGWLGLPRLRRPPEVSGVTAESASVSFTPWKDDYDDGQLPAGQTVSDHVLLYWVKDARHAGVVNQSVSASPVALTELQAGTTYQVQVLVRVSSGCMADGTVWGRVHTTTFTTPCPSVSEMLPPGDVQATDRKNTSFTLTWTPLSYLESCGFNYFVSFRRSATPPTSATTTFHTEARKTYQDLTPDTGYTVRVGYYKDSAYSSSPEHTFETLMAPPGKPTVTGRLDGNYAIFSWPLIHNSQYQYQFKIERKACSHPPNFSVWSDAVLTHTLKLSSPPYSTVSVRVRGVNSGGTGPEDSASVEVPAAVPDVRVTSLTCVVESIIRCIATLEKNCRKNNGPNLAVLFVLERRNYGNEIKKKVNRSIKASVVLSNLLPYTNYTVRAVPANDKGSTTNVTLITEKQFRSSPATPGKVRALRVVEAARSLQVFWGEPLDDPPRGKLQRFRVTWKPKGSSRSSTRTVGGDVRSYLIANLMTNQEYEITVEAKNEGTYHYGEEATTTATTRPGRPPVSNLAIETTTETRVSITWGPPRYPEGTIVKYSASLFPTRDQTRHQNLTFPGSTTRAEFTGLGAGQEYQARVTACNSEHCSDEASLHVWTLPEPPSVEGETTLLSSTNISLTIQLPTLTNPPGLQWVVMAEEGRHPRVRGWKEKFKEKAEELVCEQGTDISGCSRTSGSRGLAAPTNMWIAAQVSQEDGKQRHVTVGGNTDAHDSRNPRQLRPNAWHWVAVVTEVVRGPHVKRQVSEPQRYHASFPSKPKVAKWVDGVYVLLVLLALAMAAGVATAL